MCFFADTDAAGAYAAFLREVFAVSRAHRARPDPAWTPFAYFETDGSCAAGIEATVLRVVADARPLAATAIRLAGVVEAHRGKGLFRELMTHALAWCTAQSEGPTLLYTETPELYRRFGFVPLAQHAFGGAPPAGLAGRRAEIVDRAQALRLIDRLAPARAPISATCAIDGAPDLLRDNLESDDGLLTAYAADLDALIVFEIEDDTLVIADVVAATIPSLAGIVGALHSPCRRVRTLFPPDRLGWEGDPQIDDTGLMVRGPLPPAMTRPFMLPPTTGF